MQTSLLPCCRRKKNKTRERAGHLKVDPPPPIHTYKLVWEGLHTEQGALPPIPRFSLPLSISHVFPSFSLTSTHKSLFLLMTWQGFFERKLGHAFWLFSLLKIEVYIYAEIRSKFESGLCYKIGVILPPSCLLSLVWKLLGIDPFRSRIQALFVGNLNFLQKLSCSNQVTTFKGTQIDCSSHKPTWDYIKLELEHSFIKNEIVYAIAGLTHHWQYRNTSEGSWEADVTGERCSQEQQCTCSSTTWQS